MFDARLSQAAENFAALAEAAGLIGVEEMDETAIIATASSISERVREIQNLLSP